MVIASVLSSSTKYCKLNVHVSDSFRFKVVSEWWVYSQEEIILFPPWAVDMSQCDWTHKILWLALDSIKENFYYLFSSMRVLWKISPRKLDSMLSYRTQAMRFFHTTNDSQDARYIVFFLSRFGLAISKADWNTIHWNILANYHYIFQKNSPNLNWKCGKYLWEKDVKNVNTFEASEAFVQHVIRKASSFITFEFSIDILNGHTHTLEISIELHKRY